MSSREALRLAHHRNSSSSSNQCINHCLPPVLRAGAMSSSILMVLLNSHLLLPRAMAITVPLAVTIVLLRLPSTRHLGIPTEQSDHTTTMNEPIRNLLCVDGVSRKEQPAIHYHHRDSMDRLDLIKQVQAVMVQEQSIDRHMVFKVLVLQTTVVTETAMAHLDPHLVRAQLSIDGMAHRLATALLQVHLSKAFHHNLDLDLEFNKANLLLLFSIKEHHLLLALLLYPTTIVSSKLKKCSNSWHRSNQATLQSLPPLLLRRLRLPRLLPLPLLQQFLLCLPTLRHYFKWLKIMLPRNSKKKAGRRRIVN